MYSKVCNNPSGRSLGTSETVHDHILYSSASHGMVQDHILYRPMGCIRVQDIIVYLLGWKDK